MLDSRDNSVLKSLKELRKQEEDRVKKEKADADARAAAERQAKEDAERKAKEAVEQARREEEARARQIEETKQAREREERLRLQEAERRARIEAETALAQEKMRLDAQVRTATKAANRAPVGLIAGIIVVGVVLAGGVIIKIRSDHQKQLAAQEAEKEAAIEREKLRAAEQERRFELVVASLNRQLAEAKSDVERAAIQKKIDETQASRHASTGTHTSASREKKEALPASLSSPDFIKKKKEVSNDPLDGLKL